MQLDVVETNHILGRNCILVRNHILEELFLSKSLDQSAD